MEKIGKTIVSYLVVIFSFFILLNSSCSSGKKAFEQGNYYGATLKAVDRLRSNPDSKKAGKTLSQSYPFAVQYIENQATAAMALQEVNKYKKVVQCYEQLNHMAAEIQRCPAALKVIPNPKTYFAELKTARDFGAEEQYKLGLTELDKETRQNARQAYYHFMEADRMVKNYKNTSELIPKAKYIATLKVLVENIPVSGTENELSSLFFYNEVFEQLRKSNTTEFVRFINEHEMEMEQIQPDQLLKMHFQEFVLGQMYDKETIREVSKDSVVVGSVKLEDGTELDAYNTVKARVKVYHRELSSGGVLDVLVMNAYSGQVESQKKFPGQFTWVSEWGSYTGDERALTNKDKKLITLQGEYPPAPQQLFVEFTRPIYNQVLPYLSRFYSQY